MKKILTLSIFLHVSTLCIAQEERLTLYEFRKDPHDHWHTKWGFTNEAGAVVVQPVYDCVRPFAFGRARVNRGGSGPQGYGGKWGYIDTKGSEVIPLQYDYASDFTEGLAFVGNLATLELNTNVQTQVRTNESKSWVIDTNGIKVITFGHYVDAEEFSEGLACIYERGEYHSVGQVIKTHYIDRTGKEKFVIAGYGHGFREGLASFSPPVSNATERPRIGFIDKTGQIVIKPIFSGGLLFSCGLAAVHTLEGSNKRKPGHNWGYIDKSGQFIIKPQFNEAGDFVGGFAKVHEGGERPIVFDAYPHWQGGEWFIIDTKGRFIRNSNTFDEEYSRTKRSR